MVKIEEVSAKPIEDTRGEKTILVKIKTNAGVFSSSSPTGKSTGKYEAKPYKTSLESDIEAVNKLSEYFSNENLECFDDLKRIEDILDRQVGANTLFAVESAALKAIAEEQGKEVWELINPEAKDSPRFVGNCIGGGKHSQIEGKKPDFQEFLLVPNEKSAEKSFELMKKIKTRMQTSLKQYDEKFQNKKNDENAWISSLNEREILNILNETGIPLGVDVASSSFFKRKKYRYLNPKLDRTAEEQINYLESLISNTNLFYIEDPFEEEDFDSFAKLTEKFPDRLIVGDDLIVTNLERLKKAVEHKSVNAIIVKPNQIGSLLEVKEVCELAKKKDIKLVFSHRSGETSENILADLAWGFQADFFKCGIDGSGREEKIKRIIEIEKSVKDR